MRLKPLATPMRGSTKPFGEEPARLERGDHEYAEICEAVRQAKDKGEQASLSADKPTPSGTLGLRPRKDVLTSRCCDRRDTDAVVKGKGVAEVCLAQLGRQLCGCHQRRAVREPCDRQPARGSPASSRTSLIYRTTFSPISERCGALRLRICAAWMPLGRCCSWRAWPALRRFALELRLLRRNGRDLRCATLGGTWPASRRLHRYGHLFLDCHRCLLVDLTNLC